jgi:hypothetical protein
MREQFSFSPMSHQQQQEQNQNGGREEEEMALKSTSFRVSGSTGITGTRGEKMPASAQN